MSQFKLQIGMEISHSWNLLVISLLDRTKFESYKSNFSPFALDGLETKHNIILYFIQLRSELNILYSMKQFLNNGMTL